MTSARGRSRAGGDQIRANSDGSVAVDAIKLYRGTRFAVNFSVAVIVLAKMAIGTLHSLFKVNVGEVHRLAETIGIFKCDLLAVRIKPVALAIVRVHSSISPAVAMKIGELRGL